MLKSPPLEKKKVMPLILSVSTTRKRCQDDSGEGGGVQEDETGGAGVFQIGRACRPEGSWRRRRPSLGMSEIGLRARRGKVYTLP